MEDSVIRNNQVGITGKVHTGFEFSHEVYGEGFYTFYVLVPRLSDNQDIIPITISERIIDISKDYIGEYVKVSGQFRSYNRHVEGRNRLVLTIFAREIFTAMEEDLLDNPNSIVLDGYICKAPLYRTTPFGREITDLLLAVNRPYNKSDYIPCICWGRNAKYSSEFQVGDRIKITGRIQSRCYQKKTEDEQMIQKIAYEVSISKIEKD